MQHPEGLGPELHLIAVAQQALPAEIKDEVIEFDVLHDCRLQPVSDQPFFSRISALFRYSAQGACYLSKWGFET